METKNNIQKFTEILQKVKNQSNGFKNEINEVVDDFTSVITNYIVELQSHFENVQQKYNKKIQKLQTEIEDKEKNYQFEESNYNRVSFIKQQDKEINDAKIKIEELEMKLKYAEKQLNEYKTTSIKTNSFDLDTSHLEKNTLNEDNTENCKLTQCLARIGKKRYKFVTLSEEEQNAYPSNVFISKSGYVLGKSCPIMVKLENDFCEEHSDGYSNITLKPPREKRNKKQKANKQEETKQETKPEEVVDEEETKPEEVVEEEETKPEEVVEEEETKPKEVVEEEEIKQEEVVEEEEIKQEEVVEITDPPTFDNIDMYESDGGTSYYEDMREQYKGYLYEITEDEEIGAFVKIKK